METYRTFNPKEFNTLVLSNFKNESVYVNYDKCAKNLVMTTIKHSGYNVEDAYNHLHSILSDTYPDYQDAFNSKKWSSFYLSNIKKGGELAAKLQAVLETMGKRKNNDELREKFFLCMEEMGKNTKILKMDMAIDLFGWIETLELICKLAGYETDENFYDKIQAVKKSEKDETPVRGRSKSVARYTKDGELIKIYSSVQEAVEVLSSETGKDCKYANIYQALREGGSAYGYKWKYQEVSVSETETSVEVLHEVNPADSSEIIKEKLGKPSGKSSDLLVAYYLTKEKELDKTREIGRYSSQQDACNSLGIDKGVLSNYLKGRKASIKWNNEDGLKVRIGFERVAT